jgi:DNA-binding LacI/PurR family transcriptional regulator
MNENHEISAILSLNSRMTLGALAELTQRGPDIAEDIAFAAYGKVEGLQY